MPNPNSYTIALDAGQSEKLRRALKERSYEFRTVPYARFAAGNGKVQIVAYESGKCVIQGKGTQEFVEFVLEPEVTGEVKMGYDELHHPERYAEHIGVDESGKGDFFGPLVVAGVYASDEGIAKMIELGVRDSKTISSSKVMREIAEGVGRIRGVKVSVIAMSNTKYNELQKRMGNVNELLGWCHGCVIENLLTEVPGCPRAVSDQFARTEYTIKKHLGPLGKKIQLDQMHKAEADPVVAAASIVARFRFEEAIRALSVQFGVKIPFGASAQVKETARQLLKSHGTEAVAAAVKTHFKTWGEIQG
jgi:ribonuclease HIII